MGLRTRPRTSYRFRPASAFRREVATAVAEYFRATGRRRHAPASMMVKTGILLAGVTVAYVALLMFSSTIWTTLPLALLLGLGIAAVMINVQHDAGHGAYARGWVNGATRFSRDVLGGSSYLWRVRHNLGHHTFPNVWGADEDIDVGGVARLSPHARRRWFHAYQHLYVWLLYAGHLIKRHLLDDLRLMSGPIARGARVPAPAWSTFAWFWTGKVAFVGLAFALPLTRHAAIPVIATYVLVSATAGLLVGVAFRLAHASQEVGFDDPDGGRVQRDWARHQVESTANFAPSNRLLTWLLGGLNFQIEHHLFPRVCHVHYPALAPIVARLCRQHGLRYVAYPTAWMALRSHYRWLKLLGQDRMR